MKSAASFKLALVTAPNLKTARRLAQLALRARLVACVNLLPSVESHYWWKNKIENAREILLLFKTTSARVAALEKLIIQNHPYDTPEFIVLSLQAGAARYLRWWTDSTRRAP